TVRVPECTSRSPTRNRKTRRRFTMRRTRSSVILYLVATLVLVLSRPAEVSGQELVATIKVGTFPGGLSLSPDESLLYVPVWGEGFVSVVDLSTLTVIDQIPTAPGTNWVTFTPDGAEAWVANWGDDTVSVIDPKTRQVTHQIPVARGPHNVVFTPDGAEA